jgi:hypothetical protein
MKVFWKQISKLEDVLGKNQHTLEQITIPGKLLEGIKESLETSRDLLPPSSKTFQDWHIGLLRRFRSSDLSSADS